MKIGATLNYAILPTCVIKDESPTTVTIALTAPTPAPAWLSYDVKTGVFKATPPLTDFTTVKVFNCKVTLTDNGSLTKDHLFDLTVTNTAPVFTPDPPLTVTTPWKVKYTMTLPPFTDGEGHAATYGVTATNSFITFKSPSSVDIDPKAASDCGKFTFSVFVTDGALTTTKVVALDVTSKVPVYNPPLSFVPTPTPIPEYPLNTKISISLGTSKAEDPDDLASPVTVTVADITTGITPFADAAISSTAFTATPNAFGMIGVHTMKITLKDICNSITEY